MGKSQAKNSKAGLIDNDAEDKVPPGTARSTHWPAVRARHLALFSHCAVCGGTKALEVHHKRPFHLHPELELDPDNLITLCENKADGVNCHLFVGHLGSFKSFNPDVDADAKNWALKLAHRPLADVSA